MGKLKAYLSQAQDFISDIASRNVVLNDLYQEALETLFNDNKEPLQEAVVLKVFPQNQTAADIAEGKVQYQSAILRIPRLHDCIPDPARILKETEDEQQVNNIIELHGVYFSKEPISSVEAAADPSSLLKVGDTVSIQVINGIPRIGEVKGRNMHFASLAGTQPETIGQTFLNTKPVPLSEIMKGIEGDPSKESLEAASNNPALAGNKITNGKLPTEALYTHPTMKDLGGRPVQILKEVSDEFLALLNDFKQHFGYELELTDTYRSYERQKTTKDTFTTQGKGHLAATPGRSPHGWALAFDCNTVGKDGIKGFGGEIYKWLFVNAPKRGFWNPSWLQKGARNKDGKSTEEAWHWEVINKSAYLKVFNAVETEQAE